MTWIPPGLRRPPGSVLGEGLNPAPEGRECPPDEEGVSEEPDAVLDFSLPGRVPDHYRPTGRYGGS